jgi:hypothetical protein
VSEEPRKPWDEVLSDAVDALMEDLSYAAPETWREHIRRRMEEIVSGPWCGKRVIVMNEDGSNRREEVWCDHLGCTLLIGHVGSHSWE